MYDIAAVGECLIDFVSIKNQTLKYEGFAGGAPANVLAQAAKLGLKTIFIGKAGDDAFGGFLKSTLAEYKIDTSCFLLSRHYPTTLAFISLNNIGERSFSFYRKNSADINLTEKDIDFDVIKSSKILHFGSVSLTDEPSRSATLSAVRFAKQNGLLISYDPNLRKMLWEDLSLAKEMMLTGMEYADIVKISDEELLFLSGQKDIEQAMEELCMKYEFKLLAVTMGAAGCRCRAGDIKLDVPAYQVESIDTTGAGDAFMGALLYRIISEGISFGSADELLNLLNFSNAAGALATTKNGAMPAMSDLREIDTLMKRNN